LLGTPRTDSDTADSSVPALGKESTENTMVTKEANLLSTFATLFAGRVIAAGIVLMLCGAPSYAAAGSGPFADLAGSWSGGGRLYTAAGSEPIRCRAQYGIGDRGETAQQDLVCASPSYRLNVKSSVAGRGGRVRGTWDAPSFGVQGSISGVVHDGRIQATISGQSFTASLDLATHGNTQRVTITSESTGGNIREVGVVLRRG
jgi:hypothetical protein